MFVREHQNQFRTANADVQMFYALGESGGTSLASKISWNKPPGVSHVYMMLIGPGAAGDGAGTGGGSGAVTVWYGAAQHVPDSLLLRIGQGGSGIATGVFYRASSIIQLLSANAAQVTAGGTASASTFFGASGFYQSVAGQNGSSTQVSASATTFLSAGTPSVAADVTGNYGYVSPASFWVSYFQLQPIIVGVGSNIASRRCGIGCGCGPSTASGGLAGHGMVLIASW
jgi:hypothetical protein